MNSKNVLKRIVSLLSAEEVKFASAKLVDGTIVESEDFAVGSEVFVVSEDGRELAPDAEHRVIIDDKEFKVVTEGGVITSVEEVETEEVEAEEEVKVEEEVEMSGEESNNPSKYLIEDTAEKVELEEEIVEEEVEEEPLTLEKIVEKMSYRIDELEKKIADMQEIKEEIKEEVKEEMEEEEEDLPVLDGAPVEMSKSQTKLGKKASQSYESKFLSRLYN